MIVNIKVIIHVAYAWKYKNNRYCHIQNSKLPCSICMEITIGTVTFRTQNCRQHMINIICDVYHRNSFPTLAGQTSRVQQGEQILNTMKYNCLESIHYVACFTYLEGGMDGFVISKTSINCFHFSTFIVRIDWADSIFAVVPSGMSGSITGKLLLSIDK